MTPVLSRAEARAFDSHAIAECRVPGILLMENAGGRAAAIIDRDWLGDGRPVTIVCGTGNNGGDGFVIARHLLERGRRVRVFLAGGADKCSGSARTSLDAYSGLGGNIEFVEAPSDLETLSEALTGTVIVDALFGTGLDRPVTGLLAEVIDRINRASAARISIDVPSGMCADTGRPLGASVQADCTVTFRNLKRGLVTPSGAILAGKVHVVGFGVPNTGGAMLADAANAIDMEDVAGWLRRRRLDVHKNEAGHVVVFAGSRGKTGAAALTARGALRAGAGVCTVATWGEATSAVETTLSEALIATLNEQAVAASVDSALAPRQTRIDLLEPGSCGDETGFQKVNSDRFSARDVNLVNSPSTLVEGPAEKRTAVVGPGFGLDGRAQAVVAHLLRHWRGICVLDADALSIVARGDADCATSTAQLVLTPHPGEAARLLGCSSEEVEANRFEALGSLVRKTRAVVLLKGAFTLIGAPDGRIAVNSSGNCALATAGSGDVLAGVIGAFGAQLPPFEAACAGAFVHGLAADIWSREGERDRGMLASEIADHIPLAIAQIQRACAPAAPGYFCQGTSATPAS